MRKIILFILTLISISTFGQREKVMGQTGLRYWWPYIKGDTIAIGTTSPAAKFHVVGSARLDLGSDAAGDMYFRNGTPTLTRLPVGSANQILRTNSGATAPEWFTPTYISSGGSGYVDQGTYTPTLTSVANVDATTGLSIQWLRVGNVVHVSGAFDVDATTTATTTQIGISLPVSTSITDEFHCGGTANTTYSGGSETGNIRGDVSNSRVELRFVSSSTSNQRWFFTFSYRINPS